MADRFDKFTERARQVLSMAYQEAQDFGQSGIDTEHILLAIIDEGEGIAVRVLYALGGRLPPLRRAIVARIEQGQGAPAGEVGLTPRAKRVIELAVEEARRLNHHYIGDEHLLLGLTRVVEGIAAQVLHEFGIDHDRAVGQMIAVQSAGAQQADWRGNTPHLIRNPVHPPSPELREAMAQLEQLRQQERELQRRISQMLRAASGGSEQALPGAQSSEPIDFDRFTEQARQVLVYALEEAQRFGHNYIGTEHILLGLTRDPDTVAARVLDSFGVDLARVRSAVEFIIGRGQTTIMGAMGLTPRTQQALTHAVDEAQRLGHTQIGPEHLLLGLAREGEGIAAGVLASMGVSLERLRAEFMRIVAAGSAAPAPATPSHPHPSRDAVPPHQIYLGMLLQVIPIVEQQERPTAILTAIALERYDNGFAIGWRVRLTNGQGEPPLWECTAADERGNRYRSAHHGGSADGGTPDDHAWRFAHLFGPALDPTARSLTVECVPVIAPAAANIGPDTWHFTVAIPPLPGN